MKILGVITIFLPGIVFTILYFSRASFPYNDEGRFFDADEGVIYHEHVAEFYGICAVLTLLLPVVIVLCSVVRTHSRTVTIGEDD